MKGFIEVTRTQNNETRKVLVSVASIKFMEMDTGRRALYCSVLLKSERVNLGTLRVCLLRKAIPKFSLKSKKQQNKTPPNFDGVKVV